MKVTQVCPRYYPYMGGVERVVKNIAEYLVKRGHEVTVYATDPYNNLPRFQVINGVKVRNYPALAPNESYHLPYPNMLIHLLREQTDIIHVHSVHALTAPMAHIAHNLNNRPKFILSPYYHGRGHITLAQILWAPYKCIVREILKNADAIIVNSRSQREIIERTFKPSSKIFVVYDGVDLNKIKNAKPFAPDGDHKILLYIGRLEKYKNVHVIIASIKYLPENYHLYIIGHGPLKSYLEGLVQSLSLRKRVHFLSFQPDEVIYRWLKTAHTFVHLSNVESFGMTCIESLAAGTPVIANDDGFGLKETIDLYPKHIIKYCVAKEPISKLAELVVGAAQMKSVTVDLSRFSWNFIAENVKKIYEQILC